MSKESNSNKKSIIIGACAGGACLLLVLGIILLKHVKSGLDDNIDHLHTYEDGICTECGQTDPNYVPHTHDYEATVTDPTCTEGGYTTYSCSCGDSYTSDETEPIGHSYEPVVTEPTCTEDGFTTYTCSKCGDEYTDDIIEATGHEYEEGVCVICGEEEPPEELNEDESDGSPNDVLPKTGESNIGIVFIIFMVFSVIGIIYTMLVFIFPKRND